MALSEPRDSVSSFLCSPLGRQGEELSRAAAAEAPAFRGRSLAAAHSRATRAERAPCPAASPGHCCALPPARGLELRGAFGAEIPGLGVASRCWGPYRPRRPGEAFQLPLPQELFADLARSSSGGSRGFSKELCGSRVSGVIKCRAWDSGSRAASTPMLSQLPSFYLLFFHISPPSSLLLFSFLLLSAPKFQRPSVLDLGPPRRPELGWVGSQPHRKRASLAFPCSCPGLGSAPPPRAGSAASLLCRRGVRAQLPSLSTAVGAAPAVWVFAPPRAAGYVSYFSQSPTWRALGVWSQGWWVPALVCHEQFLYL